MRRHAFLLAGAILSLSVTSSFAQRGPSSMFDSLVGDWHGFSQQNDIEVHDNGDVMQSNAPRARVADATYAGSNFAFSGTVQGGDPYTCYYYIRFLRGDRADWKLLAHEGDYDCPRGMYEMQ